MTKLNSKARKALPSSDFGVPSKAPGSGSYPMPDAKHAAVAKAYAKRYASPAERAKINAKANSVIGGKQKKRGK